MGGAYKNEKNKPVMKQIYAVLSQSKSHIKAESRKFKGSPAHQSSIP